MMAKPPPIDKVCPVVIRTVNSVPQILAFRHPHAGCQLVKGGLRSGESPAQGALRELQEESGLIATRALAMGTRRIGALPLLWHFYQAILPHPPPEHWTHAAADDHGHSFAFFWHPLRDVPDAGWAAEFHDALDFVRGALPQTR